MLGGERSKGSHSMAMYHSAELCYLAAVYSNLERREQPMDLFFTPGPGAFGGVLRVAPDLLPPKTVKIMQVWVNGHEHADFDADTLTVTLPHSTEPQEVRVRLTGAACAFSADVLEVSGDIARISLAGSLGASQVDVLRRQLDEVLDGGTRSVVLETGSLVYLDPEAVRYLATAKQHRDFRLTVAGAQGQVAEELMSSELDQELVRIA
jgi:hypothetical protein